MPIQGFEDWDFWLGALENGWQFRYLHRIFFEYRKAPESMIIRTKGFEWQVKAFIAKKHGLVYGQAWRQNRDSMKRTCRNLGRLVKSRLNERLTAVRLKAAKEFRLLRERFAGPPK